MRRLILSCLLVVLLLVGAAPAQADGPASHVVAWGETLYSISRLFGISPQALAAANGLSLASWVYAGERLVIPGRGAPARADPASQTTPSGIYTVRAGDTLTGVARQFALSVDALAAANNMPANGVLYTGWQLKIPAAGAASAAANGLIAIPSPPPPAASAARTAVTYIVQPGDTLFRIALNYDSTTQAIALANNLPSFFVYSGQRLTIPDARATALTPVSPAPAAVSSALNLRVGGVPLYRQQQTLTCEEAAAAMALRGALGEAQIVNAMPRSDNPFDGIRGGTNYPLYGGLDNYGTYAQGLQKGLAALGRASTVLYGQAYPDFKNAVLANLRAGAPVIWWTTWRQVYEAPVRVRTSGGAVKLVPYEHTVVLVAATDAGVTYDDPYDATVRFTGWASFQRVSAYFDNMALVVQ